MFMALLFLTHQIGITLFRVIATASRQIVVANAGGMLLLLCVFLMNGFVIRRAFIHPWVVWYAFGPTATCGGGGGGGAHLCSCLTSFWLGGYCLLHPTVVVGPPESKYKDENVLRFFREH